jgi:hypothetical protein
MFTAPFVDHTRAATKKLMEFAQSGEKFTLPNRCATWMARADDIPSAAIHSRMNYQHLSASHSAIWM